MDEVVPLASDYIGNTLVQKVRCSRHFSDCEKKLIDRSCSCSSSRRRRSAKRCLNALHRTSPPSGMFPFGSIACAQS